MSTTPTTQTVPAADMKRGMTVLVDGQLRKVTGVRHIGRCNSLTLDGERDAVFLDLWATPPATCEVVV